MRWRVLLLVHKAGAIATGYTCTRFRGWGTAHIGLQSGP